ncbi:MAG: hypothetical protein AB1426_01460 [Bacillota bacterium]
MLSKELIPALLTDEQLSAVKELEKKLPADGTGRKLYILAVTCREEEDI